MRKGIIVVDAPGKCDNCPVRHPGLAKCLVTGRSTSHTEKGRPMNEEKRPSWCPILPLPDRKPPSPAPSPMLEKAGYFTPYDKGWNDCIEKMGGKDNESDHEIPRK